MKLLCLLVLMLANSLASATVSKIYVSEKSGISKFIQLSNMTSEHLDAWIEGETLHFTWSSEKGAYIHEGSTRTIKINDTSSEIIANSQNYLLVSSDEGCRNNFCLDDKVMGVNSKSETPSFFTSWGMIKGFTNDGFVISRIGNSVLGMDWIQKYYRHVKYMTPWSEPLKAEHFSELNCNDLSRNEVSFQIQLLIKKTEESSKERGYSFIFAKDAQIKKGPLSKCWLVVPYWEFRGVR